MITHNDSDTDVGRSLSLAVTVMKKLSQRSRQAEHYLWILRDMQKDIEVYQDQIATRRRESSHRPVKRVLRVPQKSNGFSPQSQSGLQSGAGSSWTLPEGFRLDTPPLATFTVPPTASPPLSSADLTIPAWEFPSIQFWDDFSQGWSTEL